MADVPIPGEITTWMESRNWGRHHLQWHVERGWDRLSPPALAWAQGQGWTRYRIQEGEETNGLAFLAMHRVMIRMLVAQFPPHAGLFAGWTSPPTDPNDPNDPVPSNSAFPGPFFADMVTSIARIEEHASSFDGDDDFGLYIQTRWRPFPNRPTRRSLDPSTGIHNYIHGRFSDGNSPINMGNPQVNLQNERFWRLHGWIDRKWTDYRTASGRSENDPTYKAALDEAEHHMVHLAPTIAAEAIAQPMPPEIARSIARVLFGS
jgi:hypothetical protein